MGDRQALVVGVSGERSLGFAIARALRSRGDDVTVTCRPARLDGVRALAEREGFAVRALDVDDPAAIVHALGAFARLDALVHTVMHVPPGVLARPFVEVDPAIFADVLTRPSASLLALCAAARPAFARAPCARVVTLSSALAERPGAGYHVAGVAKAALESTARTLARELGPERVLVNVLRCGLVDTDGARGAVGEPVVAAMSAALARKSPTRAAPSAEDVAAAAAWLTGPDCRNTTAQILDVDGGFSASYG